MLQSLGVSGILAVVFMAISLVGMIICSKKQNTSAIAKPIAVLLMVVVIGCAVTLLIKTGVIGNQATNALMANELKYSKSSYFILGKQLAEKMPNAKTLLLIDTVNPNDKRSGEMMQAFKDGAAGKLVFSAEITPMPEGIKPDPTGMMMPLSELLKAKDFNTVIGKYPTCNLIVSFIGLPRDIENLSVWSMPSDKQPKIALLNASTYDLKNAIKTGAVIAAVTMNPAAKFDEKPAPKDVKAAFDVRYIMLTPDNVDKMAEGNKNMFAPDKVLKK